MIRLQSYDKAFTQGGNRLCFVHPQDPRLCIKLARPDRTPQLRRKQKGLLKRLFPLRHFDENYNEICEYANIESHIGDGAFTLIPRCHGWLDTDLGQALCLEMVRDADQKVSMSLKQYLWLYGITEDLQLALDTFESQWQRLGMPSRDLLLHNIVVEQALVDEVLKVKRLVVIDGLGWASFSWLLYRIKPWAQSRSKKKIRKLKKLITAFVSKEKNSDDWGYHGWLDESQRVNK